MPRRRTKARLDHLTEALDEAQRAGVCLAEIDLRTTTGELRRAIKAARVAAEALRAELQRAILADVPSHPAYFSK